MSIGKRLRMTLEQCEMSVREFQRQMEERSVRGSSYPTIHRYLTDKSEPSMAFLKSAAELLGVREIWLAQGHGEPTETAEAMNVSAGPSPDAEEIFQTIGLLPEIKSLPNYLRGGFYDAWYRRVGAIDGHRGQKGKKDQMPDPEIARVLGREILMPFEAMGIEPDPDSPRFRDYVSAMLVALNLATTVPGK